jgi:hypothetical protein
MTPTEKLETAIAELENIEASYSAKIEAAKVAFDADPTEANADAVATAERVSKLFTERAKRKVAEAESEVAAEHRVGLEQEAAELAGLEQQNNERLESFIDRGVEVEISRLTLEREVESFVAEVSHRRLRIAEIRAELGGYSLDHNQRLNASGTGNMDAVYRMSVAEHVKDALRKPINKTPAVEAHKPTPSGKKTPLSGDKFGT